MAELKTLDEHRAAVLEKLCEAIVPGSSRVGPVLYIDAIVASMPSPQRDAVIHSIDTLEEGAAGGAEALGPLAATPDFQLIRALAVEAYYSDFLAPGAPGPSAYEEIDFLEAYYSDFLAPGAPGPSAYEEIDFHSPLAMRIKKDWSYLGIQA